MKGRTAITLYIISVIALFSGIQDTIPAVVTADTWGTGTRPVAFYLTPKLIRRRSSGIGTTIIIFRIAVITLFCPLYETIPAD